MVLRQAKIHHTLWAAELWLPGRQLGQARCSGAGGEGGRERSQPATPGGGCRALGEQGAHRGAQGSRALLWREPCVHLQRTLCPCADRSRAKPGLRKRQFLRLTACVCICGLEKDLWRATHQNMGAPVWTRAPPGLGLQSQGSHPADLSPCRSWLRVRGLSVPRGSACCVWPLGHGRHM